ncbi:MlaE family ABC transporter permease [endosymbiont of Lamellibrachia barhami]|uniref:MlaE family ABC transporter permease n=1 Tax=endosymbiont of Lamellibrachia barhami TaxID=205975 RepID=UPI0015ADDC18|nr:ABC transporter permease [endosymbiont of Lamellibrachia barhami]
MNTRKFIERIGEKTIDAIEEVGYHFSLLVESFYWLLVGPFVKQPVRLHYIFSEMMKIGVLAIPVVILLSFSNGIMMAIQGIVTLQEFNAESQVVPGIAYSVTREFGVLITAIVVAGRSGSAIAARIGSMQMSQEVDALRVMGIEPVRHLVAPIIFSMLVMMPILTIMADSAALIGGGLYTGFVLKLSLGTFIDRCFDVLVVYDVMQGLYKSLIFGVLIALVACSNGFSVSGGAEGLGKATTRSVVMSIAMIVMVDMIFTYFLSR